MATPKALIALFLISLLAFNLVDANVSTMNRRTTGRSLLPTIDCGAACGERCKLSSRPNLCHRACGTCCKRCNCVPPGTSGNEDVCPCYANMTTHGGRHKCP